MGIVIKRTLYRDQKPELVSESELGYIYSMKGIESTDAGDREVVINGPQLRSRKDAGYAARRIGREWLAEIGPVNKEGVDILS